MPVLHVEGPETLTVHYRLTDFRYRRHAGALLWHVRRYSSNSFLEPFAIYAATLVIWGYSVSIQIFRRHHQGESQARQYDTMRATAISPQASVLEDTAATSESEDDPEPSFIHLDRPCDDEMVQTFVRCGHKMTGHMLRVGDICAPSAPKRILKEGVRLLACKGDTEASAGQRPQTQSTQRQQSGAGAESKHQGEQGPEAWGLERLFVGVLESLIEATGD